MATDCISKGEVFAKTLNLPTIYLKYDDSRCEPVYRQKDIFEMLSNLIPAADVRPVVRGKWKAHGDCGVTECSVCGWSIEECIEFHFCPNCGADMREVDSDG